MATTTEQPPVQRSPYDDILDATPAVQAPQASSPYDDILSATPDALKPKQPTPLVLDRTAAQSRIPGMELLGGEAPPPAKPPALKKPAWTEITEAAGRGMSEASQSEPRLNTVEGIQQMAGGAKKIAQALGPDMGRTEARKIGVKIPGAPSLDLKKAAGGAADIISGGFTAAAPLAPLGIVEAPVSALLALGLGVGADEGTKAVLDKAGVPEEYRNLAGGIAALLAGGKWGHEALSKIHKAAGSPEIKFGKFEETKPFSEMTDEELIGHAAKLKADPPKNYEYQARELFKEAAKRAADKRAAGGMGQGSPGSKEVVPVNSRPASAPAEPPSAPRPPVSTPVVEDSTPVVAERPPIVPEAPAEVPTPPVAVVESKPIEAPDPINDILAETPPASEPASPTPQGVQAQPPIAPQVTPTPEQAPVTPESQAATTPAVEPPAPPMGKEGSSANVEVAPESAGAEDPNESVQDKSYREWRENFNRVSAKPEAASEKDLRRAIGFLDQRRRSII